jgi:LysM repeat protein
MNTAIRMLTTLCLCLMLSLAASAQTKRSDAKVRIGGEDFYVHAVAKGDTFYSLGKLYNVADTIIVRHNPLTSDGLKVGQMIKIPVVAPAAAPAKPTPRKGFRQHVVQKGETAYSISKLYGIPLATLIEDNKEIDPLHISEGAVLHIRKKEQGDASPAEIHQQWVEYKEAINSVSDDMIYHIVQPGETLYSLGKQYNVAVEVIAEANGITDGNLRVLSMIRIPVAKPEAETKADSTAVAVPTIDAPSQVLSSALSKSQKAEVALMLTLQGGEKSNRHFLDF